MKSILLMAAIVVVVLAGSVSISVGQGGGGDQPCGGIFTPVTLTDLTCSADAQTGCASTTFTPPECDYVITVRLICSGDCDSQNCIAWARARNDNGQGSDWIHNGSVAPDCKQQSQSFHLAGGVQAKLEVCFNVTGNTGTCAGCANEGCRAEVTISTAE